MRKVLRVFGLTRRRLLAVAAILPVLVALLVVGLSALRDAHGRELACWVLPNARVLVTPGERSCPLRLHDQIRALRAKEGAGVSGDVVNTLEAAVRAQASRIDVAVVRPDGERWVTIPIRELSRTERAARVFSAAIVVAVLLAIPLSLLWRSYARAAAPLAILYSAVSVVAVTAIAGRNSELLTRASLLSMAVVPAALAHLSFTFPRERRLIQEAPELGAVPYAVSGLLVFAGWFALERNALLWPTFVYLVIALTAGAWLILLLSCWFAIRESTSQLERARARTLCFGALLLPIGPTLLVARGANSVEEAVTAYVWISTVVIPLPIGLAISRYNLFNLRWDVRQWMGRLIYLGAASAILFTAMQLAFALMGTAHPLRDPTLLLPVCAVSVAAIEPLRRRMMGLLETVLVPRLDRLRRLREDYERQLSRLCDEDEVARFLGHVLQEALECRAGCVFLQAGVRWRPAFPFGEGPPTRITLAAQASTVLQEQKIAHLAMDLGPESCARAELRQRGVEIAGAIESGGERLGMVLLASARSGRPYSGVDLDFAATVISIAGIALRNAYLSEELLSAERRATTGRVALAMAHDLGKELDWMSRLVKRLPGRLDDHARLKRDISMIEEFTRSVLSGLRKFVGEATAPAAAAPGVVPFEVVADKALRRTSRRHGEARIAESLAPEARSVLCHESLGRVLANLLDNALHASMGREPVDLFATAHGGWLRIVVTDRGRGIPEQILTEVFRAGFSTRSDEGGLGIGLTVSREIVESMGGAIELSPLPEGGTRASIRVPIDGAK